MDRREILGDEWAVENNTTAKWVLIIFMVIGLAFAGWCCWTDPDILRYWDREVWG